MSHFIGAPRTQDELQAYARRVYMEHLGPSRRFIDLKVSRERGAELWARHQPRDSHFASYGAFIQLHIDIYEVIELTDIVDPTVGPCTLVRAEELRDREVVPVLSVPVIFDARAALNGPMRWIV
jgi:hypothetical protein